MYLRYLFADDVTAFNKNATGKKTSSNLVNSWCKIYIHTYMKYFHSVEPASIYLIYINSMQAGLTRLEAVYLPQLPIKTNEPLGMEHFYFGKILRRNWSKESKLLNFLKLSCIYFSYYLILGILILCVGIALSSLIFIIELSTKTSFGEKFSTISYGTRFNLSYSNILVVNASNACRKEKAV